MWEISITTEDGHTEYEYNRAGLYPGGKYLQTAVYVTFYDSTSVPISGSSIAKLINNKWNTDLLDVE